MKVKVRAAPGLPARRAGRTLCQRRARMPDSSLETHVCAWAGRRLSLWRNGSPFVWSLSSAPSLIPLLNGSHGVSASFTPFHPCSPPFASPLPPTSNIAYTTHTSGAQTRPGTSILLANNRAAHPSLCHFPLRVPFMPLTSHARPTHTPHTPLMYTSVCLHLVLALCRPSSFDPLVLVTAMRLGKVLFCVALGVASSYGEARLPHACRVMMWVLVATGSVPQTENAVLPIVSPPLAQQARRRPKVSHMPRHDYTRCSRPRRAYSWFRKDRGLTRATVPILWHHRTSGPLAAWQEVPP